MTPQELRRIRTERGLTQQQMADLESPQARIRRVYALALKGLGFAGDCPTCLGNGRLGGREAKSFQDEDAGRPCPDCTTGDPQ